MTTGNKFGLARAILAEVITSLPGMRKPTQYEPPEDPLDLVGESIYTGAFNTGKRIRIWERGLGLTLWLAWFGFGIYFWWFTSVPLIDYAVGVMVWGLVFMFTVLGIPITRAILRNREQL